MLVDLRIMLIGEILRSSDKHSEKELYKLDKNEVQKIFDKVMSGEASRITKKNK